MDSDIKNAVLELITDSKGLASEHIPLLLRDVIMWAQIEWIIPTIICIVSSVVFIVNHKIMNRIIAEKGGRHETIHRSEDPYMFMAMIFGMIAGIFSIASFITITNAIHATVAPYSYLLNKVTGS